MPRKARIDVAGQLYHVIARGNERGKIFLEEEDYENFIGRLRSGLNITGNKCLAWCLIPNHFHLVILRGKRPLSDLMRRLMTGYVVSFNITHKRVGHLFQNRYKAIMCEEEEYLLELVSYIHLNPLRAKLVRNYEGLGNYKWCGHGAMIGERSCDFMERDYVLGHFGGKDRMAVSRYEAFMRERIGAHKGGEYSGGGLIKSLGGLTNVLASRSAGEREMFDDRVLGGGDFVEAVLKESEGKSDAEVSVEDVRKEVEQKSGLPFKEISGRGRGREISRARALYCYLAKEKAGARGMELMKELRMSSGGISRLIIRGEEINAVDGKQVRK